MKNFQLFIIYILLLFIQTGLHPKDYSYPKDIKKNWDKIEWMEIKGYKLFKKFGIDKNEKDPKKIFIESKNKVIRLENLPKNFYYFIDEDSIHFSLFIFDQNKNCILFLHYGDFDSGDLKKETIQKNKPKVTRSLKVGNYLPPYKNNYQLTVEYFYVTKDFNICSIFLVPWLEKWFKKSLIVDLEGNL